MASSFDYRKSRPLSSGVFCLVLIHNWKLTGSMVAAPPAIYRLALLLIHIGSYFSFKGKYVFFLNTLEKCLNCFDVPFHYWLSNNFCTYNCVLWYSRDTCYDYGLCTTFVLTTVYFGILGIHAMTMDCVQLMYLKLCTFVF